MTSSFPAPPSPFRRADARLTARRLLAKNFLSLEEASFEIPRYSGGRMEMSRDFLRVGEVCVGLPYDPALDRVLMVEQFRVGPWALGEERPWIMEAVAGFIDPGETPEEAVRREAREEAGLEIGPEGLWPVGVFYSSPGTLAERIHAYLLRADLSEAGGLHGLADENENIRAVVMAFDEAMSAAQDGRPMAGPTLVALYALALRRPALRAQTVSS